MTKHAQHVLARLREVLIKDGSPITRGVALPSPKGASLTRSYTGNLEGLMIVDARERVCETCRYFSWMADEEQPNYGVCRRFPPVMGESGCLNGFWPVIEKTNWCGEHDYCADIQRE